MNKGGNRISFLIVIIIAGILLIAFMSLDNFLSFEKEKSEKISVDIPTLIEECKNVSSKKLIECENEIIEKLIIQTDSPELCDYYLNNPYCKKMEIIYDVFETKNPSLCDSLEDSISCKNNYYLSKAIFEKNFLLCEKIEGTDLKNDCFDRVNYNLAISIEDCSILNLEKYIKGCNNEIK